MQTGEEVLVGRRIVKAEIKEHRWGNKSFFRAKLPTTLPVDKPSRAG